MATGAPAGTAFGLAQASSTSASAVGVVPLVQGLNDEGEDGEANAYFEGWEAAAVMATWSWRWWGRRTGTVPAVRTTGRGRRTTGRRRTARRGRTARGRRTHRVFRVFAREELDWG